MVLALRSQLDALAPRFWVPSGRISVMLSPEEFYKHLCRGILSAKKRVFLASLYIGKDETELIETIEQSLGTNKDLHVSIMTDGLRGTREAPHNECTASLLAPLAAKFPERVRLHQYQTPRMTPMLKAVLPKRFNEGVGLQHMKLYGFDDEIVLSGANLSRDYFTDRQDRYISISDTAVTNYFWQVYSAVAALSQRLGPGPQSKGGFTLSPPDPELVAQGAAALQNLLKPSQTKSKTDADEKGTFVYPVCQFSAFGVGNELAALEAVTDAMAKAPKWMATAGYFNIAPSLRQRLLTSTATEATVVTASEEANGFHGSKGLSRHIPALYTDLARKFAREAQPHGIKVKEWRNGTVNQPGGWTYHAKGVWLWPNADSNPSVTYIGSSNFTRRSYAHDLEAGAVLVSDDTKLQADLQGEVTNLLQYALEDARDTRPSLLTRVITRVLGTRL